VESLGILWNPWESSGQKDSQDSGQDVSGSAKYSYARVLSIFHLNVVYTSPGMLNYKARQIDFLWVRWFKGVEDVSVEQSWTNACLNHLHYLPMSNNEAFSFIDPAHILHGCHIIPRFSTSLHHVEGVGISECAGNTKALLCCLVSLFTQHILRAN
jgi:hypothetical protein